LKTNIIVLSKFFISTLITINERGFRQSCEQFHKYNANFVTFEM